MPKIINKGLSSQRGIKVYNIRRCTSEPLLHNKSDSYVNLLKDYTNLLRDYENQSVVKRLIDHQLEVLKSEFNSIKEEIQNTQKVSCQVCFSEVYKIDAIHMGDCGHGACRPCFVHSVVYTAIHLRQQNDVDTIEECWRCFSCREFNYSFLQYQRGILTVKYVSRRSELVDTILHDYRKLEKSLKLPSLGQHFQESEFWQEMAEENNTMDHSVTSEDTEPNGESGTCNNLRIVELENVSSQERSPMPSDVRVPHRVQIAEDLKMVEKIQIHENSTNSEEAQKSNESRI